MPELYPVTHTFVKKQGVLYPVTHTFVKKSIVPPFSITINSGADNLFILPTTGRLNNTYNSYGWIIDWGDGTTSEHAGTGLVDSGITHNYPQSNTNYKIIIKPQNESELGWLRAFGFYNTLTGSNSQANKNKVVLVDGQLTEQMIMTPYSSYICAFWFYGCINIKMGSSFNLPQEIESTGNYFCMSQFEGCSGNDFTMNSIFQLPQKLTSLNTGYFMNQFRDCSGDNFTMNSIFQIPTGILNSYASLCYGQFENCNGKAFSLNNVFQVPQKISSLVSSNFARQFANCLNITTGVRKYFGDIKINILYSGTFQRTFYNCSNLSEYLADIPQLSVIPSTQIETFRGCPPDLIAPLHANWK